MLALRLALAAVAAIVLAKPNWTEPAAPVHIVGNTYDIGSTGLSFFLIKTSAGLIVIDAGMPGYAPEVIKSIRTLGLDSHDVKWILNTHAHLDHAGAIAELKRLTGARVAAMRKDIPWLTTGTYPGDEQLQEARFPPVKVDRVLRDGDIIHLGDTSLVAHLTPGHSPGCTSWSWDETEGGRRLKVLESCSTAVGLNRLVGKPSYPGIEADYRKSFAWFEHTKADVFLAPHAEHFDLYKKRERLAAGGPNPFIDPTELGAETARSKAEFERLFAGQRAALASAAE